MVLESEFLSCKGRLVTLGAVKKFEINTLISNHVSFSFSAQLIQNVGENANFGYSLEDIIKWQVFSKNIFFDHHKH